MELALQEVADIGARRQPLALENIPAWDLVGNIQIITKHHTPFKNITKHLKHHKPFKNITKHVKHHKTFKIITNH